MMFPALAPWGGAFGGWVRGGILGGSRRLSSGEGLELSAGGGGAIILTRFVGVWY